MNYYLIRDKDKNILGIVYSLLTSSEIYSIINDITDNPYYTIEELDMAIRDRDINSGFSLFEDEFIF